MLINRTYRTWNRDYSTIYSGTLSRRKSEMYASSSSSSSSEEILPSIVQSEKFSTSSLGNSVLLTLSDLPKQDSILIAFIGVNQHLESRTCTPPDDSWTLVQNGAYLQAGQYVFWKKVIDGDGQSYSFDISGEDEFHSGIIYEVEGCDTESPIDQKSIVAVASSNNPSSEEVVPSTLNTLAISAVTTIVGATNGTNLDSVSVGWQKDQSALTTWEATFSASKTQLTSDISSAVSNTFIFNVLTMGAIVSIILLSPKYSSSSSSSSFDSSSSSSFSTF